MSDDVLDKTASAMWAREQGSPSKMPTTPLDNELLLHNEVDKTKTSQMIGNVAIWSILSIQVWDIRSAPYIIWAFFNVVSSFLPPWSLHQQSWAQTQASATMSVGDWLHKPNSHPLPMHLQCEAESVPRIGEAQESRVPLTSRHCSLASCPSGPD
eukprot:6479954-Amphidinium_carterae.1